MEVHPNSFTSNSIFTFMIFTTDFTVSPVDLSDLAFGQGAGSNIAIALQCLEQQNLAKEFSPVVGLRNGQC